MDNPNKPLHYSVRSNTGYILGQFAKERVRLMWGTLHVFARESRIETVHA